MAGAAGERAISSIFASQSWHSWEWRNDHELLLRNSDDETWLWDVERNETRKLSDRWLSNVSPDGAFAVRHFQTETTSVDDPAHIALVSLDDGREATFESVYKPWPTDAPGFQQYWSADSEWLLSTVARYHSEEQQTQYFALSRRGELVEIVLPGGKRAGHWNALRAAKRPVARCATSTPTARRSSAHGRTRCLTSSPHHHSTAGSLLIIGRPNGARGGRRMGSCRSRIAPDSLSRVRRRRLGGAALAEPPQLGYG